MSDNQSRKYTWNGNTFEIGSPELNDMQMAVRVRMLMRDQLDHEKVCTDARDRIMCLAAEKKALEAERDEAYRRRDEWRKKAEGYDAVRVALREKVGSPWPPHMSRALWAGIAADEKKRADDAEAERDALVAAAYEAAARKAYLHNLGRDYEMSQRQISDIRALTPADARAALDRERAEARKEGMTGGVAAIAEERQRQVNGEGWTTKHDDQYRNEELALAAAAYCNPRHPGHRQLPPSFWPWDREWWKPTDRRRDLVKAGALIAAEIDRLDRLAAIEDTDE